MAICKQQRTRRECAIGVQTQGEVFVGFVQAVVEDRHVNRTGCRGAAVVQQDAIGGGVVAAGLGAGVIAEVAECEAALDRRAEVRHELHRAARRVQGTPESSAMRVVRAVRELPSLQPIPPPLPTSMPRGC